MVDMPNLTPTPANIESPMQSAGGAMTLMGMMNRNQASQIQLQQASRENQDQIDTRQAFANNTTQDPQTGQPVVNTPKAIADLTSVNPYAGNQLNLAMMSKTQELQAKALENQKNTILNQKNSMDNMSSLAGIPYDQQSYDTTLQVAKQNGMDTSKFPPDFETAKPMLQTMASAGMTQSQKLEAQARAIGQQQTQSKNISDIAAQQTQFHEKASEEFIGVNTAANLLHAAVTTINNAKSTSDEIGTATKSVPIAILRMDNPTMGARVSSIAEFEEATKAFPDYIRQPLERMFNGETIDAPQLKGVLDYAQQRFLGAKANQSVLDNLATNRAIAAHVPQGMMPPRYSDPDVYGKSPLVSDLQQANAPESSRPDLAQEPSLSGQTSGQTDVAAPQQPAQPPTPPPPVASRYISSQKFNALKPEDQAKIKALGLQVRE